MMAGIKYWDVLQGYTVIYVTISQYEYPNMSLSSLQMLKIELNRPGIEPGLPALQAGTLPKELSTL